MIIPVVRTIGERSFQHIGPEVIHADVPLVFEALFGAAEC
jgi:hypothetical protein